MSASESKVYLLNSIERTQADLSGRQNLQHLYGLDDLAASVARVDAQGNKIAANKLNKTYKKQITDLGLPGRTEVTKNTFFMDGLFSGVAQPDQKAEYRLFTDSEIEAGFGLRPGELHGYVKYRPPSPPGLKRIKVESANTTPLATSFPPDFPGEDTGSRATKLYQDSRSHNARSRMPTPSPPTTRSAAYVPPEPESDEANESSDDGSRFKELERERKKRLRMKREAELAMGGDLKRRRYDIDGYEFLDSD